MNNIEQIRRDIEHLSQGPRVPGTNGHAAARDYLVRRLIAVGGQPYAGASFELPYECDGFSYVNLAARVGHNGDKAPVLVGAHYDTVPGCPGADDNGAAIAALLTAAKYMDFDRLERDVVFAFFDAEEPPYFLTPSMGSIRFYKDQRRSGFHCAVILDLVGHGVPVQGLEPLFFVLGMESNEAFVSVLKRMEQLSDTPFVPTLNRYVGDLSDHHVFRRNHVPYLFVTCGRWRHYHQAEDTSQNVDIVKTAKLADWLTQLLPVLSAAQFTGRFEGYDSTDAELHFLHRHLADVARTWGVQLKTRNDINHLVNVFTDLFHI